MREAALSALFTSPLLPPPSAPFPPSLILPTPLCSSPRGRSRQLDSAPTAAGGPDLVQVKVNVRRASEAETETPL